MKTLTVVLSLLLVSPVVLQAEVKRNGKPSETQKIAIQKKVLQVLEEGLLMANGATPFVLKGHPDEASLADGDAVNCYANRTSATMQYVDVTGAKRTVKVYQFVSKRIGK